MTKIALVGSAPSSIRLAPINDPDWQIWGCSPGAYGVVGPRADVWFEMHRWEPQVPGHAGLDGEPKRGRVAALGHNHHARFRAVSVDQPGCRERPGP